MTEDKKSSLENTFVLPEGVVPSKSESSLYEVIAIAPDCSLNIKVGDTVIVEEHMLHQRVIAGQKFLLIQDNFVEALLS